MASPFDIIKNISEKTPLDWEKKDYNPWIINRSFSNLMDTLFFANELNKYYHLDKDVQYDFYYTAIPKGKRYSSWHKEINNEDVKVIREFYNVNRRIAEKYLALLTTSQLNELKELSLKGGRA